MHVSTGEVVHITSANITQAMVDHLPIEVAPSFQAKLDIGKNSIGENI